MSRDGFFRAVILCMVTFALIGSIRSDALEPGAPMESPASVLQETPVLSVPYYPPPGRMELCGEPVPLHVQEVWERFDREFTLVVYNHAQVYLWLKRMERYFPWLESRLRAQQLPEDLKFVAVAESDLTIAAVSSAGAVGPWQFISSTGKNYGLNQTAAVDERYDFEMATESAFRYLKVLYGMYQSWPLAIAAYNCGENRVRDEIGRQKINNYFLMKLPQETERYVFRILALKAVLGNPGQYGYSLPGGAGYPEKQVEKVNIQLADPLPVQLMAEAAEITYREFKMLNPVFITDTIPAGAFMLSVPKGKGTSLPERIQKVCAQQVQLKGACITHVVKKGETLNTVAAVYSVSVQDLKKWNNLNDGGVQPGQNLKVLK